MNADFTALSLVTPAGTCQQGTLIDQLSNVGRARRGADQKIGAETRKRLDDLTRS